MLLRLRDKSNEIRGLVLRTLLAEKIPLDEMRPQQRIRLLYDGFGNKDTSVEQDTLKYIALFFGDGENITKFRDLINLFEPEMLLLHPALYSLFDSLLSELTNELTINSLVAVTKRVTDDLRHIAKGEARICRELIWLKHIAKSSNSQLRSSLEEFIPSGTELAKAFTELVKGQDLFSINECLQLFALEKSADELGRNKMCDSLKGFVQEVRYFEGERS